jgi:hypothetical protein
MIKSLAQWGQGSDKNADGCFTRGPDAEVDTVPCRVLRLCDSFELYGLEDGANGGTESQAKSAFDFQEDTCTSDT